MNDYCAYCAGWVLMPDETSPTGHHWQPVDINGQPVEVGNVHAECAAAVAAYAAGSEEEP